jgi:hypothetical protein
LLEYYHALWTADNGEEATQATPDEDKVDPITIGELAEVIKTLKTGNHRGQMVSITNSSSVHLKVSSLNS